METTNQQVAKQADKAKLAIKRQAIRSDYKHWKSSQSYEDLVNWARKCYNDYTEWGNDLTLPRDTRNSYLDRAVSFKFLLDYIERQSA